MLFKITKEIFILEGRCNFRFFEKLLKIVKTKNRVFQKLRQKPKQIGSKSHYKKRDYERHIEKREFRKGIIIYEILKDANVAF